MNRVEKNLQTKIKQWLEDKGAVVLKTNPGVLNPIGIPDLLVLYKGKWAMVEVKSSSTAEFQTLQPAQLARFKDMNPDMVFIAFPENWARLQYVLNTRIFST